jgi:hypothetical protein
MSTERRGAAGQRSLAAGTAEPLPMNWLAKDDAPGVDYGGVMREVERHDLDAAQRTPQRGL